MLIVAVLTLSCLLQIFAALAAVRLIPLTGGRYSWIFLAMAFLLMGVRRSIALFNIVILGEAPRALNQELVALGISVFCVLGIITIPRLFRDRLQKYSDLLATENRLQSILAASPVGIFVTDIDGKIVMLNQMARAMFGLKDDFDPTVQTHFYQDFLHGDDRENFLESGGRMITAGSIGRNVYRCRRTDNADFPGEISRSIIRTHDDAPQLFVVAVKDITDIRLTMHQLEEERDRADHYLDIVSDIIVILDVSGHVTLVNRTGLQLLGVGSDDVFWADWFTDFVPEKDRTEMLSKFQRLIANDSDHSIQIKSGIYDRNNILRTIRWSMRAVKNPDNRVIGAICSGEDITARESAEIALREQQRMMETLLSNLPGMAYRCMNTPDWTMKYVSRGVLELTGYMPHELIDNHETSYAALIETDFETIVWDQVQTAIQKGEPFRLSYPIRARNNTRKWVWEQGRGVCDDQGRVCYIEGFIADITQQKLAEESLQRELDFEASLIETSPVFYCALDPEGCIVMVNHAMMATTGFEREELVGRHFLDVFVTDEERPALVEIFESLLINSEASWKISKLRTKDERELTVEWHGRAVLNAKKEVEFAFGLGIDITERTRLEEERLEHQEELERMNDRLKDRNRELDEFTFIASHDLQEPVRKQLMFTDVLRDTLGAELSEDASFAVEAIEVSAARMQLLVQDLLALSRSRRQSLKLRETTLDECVETALETLSQKIEEHGHVRVERSPLPTLNVDVLLMTQVFQNLIGNALKFSDKPDTVIRISAHDPGDCWVICVADNGIGIQGEHLENVFAPFKRLHTRDEYEGSGIGLAICKKIVERHQGTVWVESIPGDGATFYMKLPKVQGDITSEDEKTMGALAS